MTKPFYYAILVLLAAALGWAYWPTLSELVQRWSTQEHYSHGFLVPVFALYLLWQRREMTRSAEFVPSMWGVACVVLGAGLHLAGAYYYVEWASAASLLPVAVGVAVALGGVQALRWSWPAIAFLVFMLPLPYRVEVALAYPLQRLATLASTYVLQMLGFAAVAEGKSIIMETTRIDVVETCNGLGMLMTFFALATGLAIVVRGSWFDKVMICVSAAPIALAANVIRISVTGIGAELFGPGFAEFFHDFAGFCLMMPVALAMLLGVRWLLGKLLIEPAEEEAASALFAARASAPAAAAAPVEAAPAEPVLAK
jgi:exosortase